MSWLECVFPPGEYYKEDPVSETDACARCGGDCPMTSCLVCGGCQCPGYCDDYQTYNLRPAETGGAVQSGNGSTIAFGVASSGEVPGAEG